MAVRKSPQARKGKNPDSIPANVEFIRNVIASGQTGVIERWKQKYSTFPKSLKEALKQAGLSKLLSNGKEEDLVEDT